MATELPERQPTSRVPIVPSGSLYDREFWDITRHELVAGAADELLTPHAKDMVRSILEPLSLVGLADVAGWADTVKRRGPNPANDDPETIAFLSDARNRDNDTWHYVNLPLRAEGYDRERYPTFTRDDDVVQITGESVRVLLGQSSRFSTTNALRLVAHLVGDLHQPIHVGCSFLKGHGATAKLTGDPDVAIHAGWTTDQGGNRLFLPLPHGSVKLHEYWDTALRRSESPHDDSPIRGNTDVASADVMADRPSSAWFIRKLVRMIGTPPGPVAAGDAATATLVPLDRHAEDWATASLVAAREAYHSLGLDSPRGGNAFNVTWEGQARYDARCKPIVERRLAEASQNLAGLINAIWPAA